MPLDESLTSYKNHREKYYDRTHEKMKGWKDHLYSQDMNYNPHNPYFADKAWGHKYNRHNSEEVISDTPYWDTKENDAYYSLTKWQRLKLHIKEKVSAEYLCVVFLKFKELFYLNLLIMLILIYYANKKSKQIML
jgi:hypothetical protein